jgi:hypothetical protein
VADLIQMICQVGARKIADRADQILNVLLFADHAAMLSFSCSKRKS